MSTAYRALLVVGVLLLLAGLVTHFAGPVVGTSSRGFLSLADAFFLLAIALAAGRLIEGPPARELSPDRDAA